jgi:hypothetical protein
MDDYQINMPCAFEAKCGLWASKSPELFKVETLLMFNMKFFRGRFPHRQTVTDMFVEDTDQGPNIFRIKL